jgi:nucleoside-diphosphate-sugar epimerase
LTFEEFLQYLPRIEIYLGDLVQPGLGLSPADKERFIQTTSSILHCAASLNRKSDKACFNVNLRGTLHLLTLARQVQEHHGLKRFSEVSTVAVAGVRQHEIVSEETMIEWERSDYDPYARTKKFCEYLIHELLPDVPQTIFRPSIILGDSRFPETTQFDMVRAFVLLTRIPLLPFRGDWKVDIVPADFVSKAIVHLHHKENPRYNAYNLSSGADSLSYRQIIEALKQQGFRKKQGFCPWLEWPFTQMVHLLAGTPRWAKVAYPASLMKVFLPYLLFDTVFENRRVVEELGEKPRPFSEYAYPLLQFAQKHQLSYPYRPWPPSNPKEAEASTGEASS